MKKLWRITGALILICLLLGIGLLAAGFFTGGSPVTVKNHGCLTEFSQRLAYNRGVLENLLAELVARIGF